MNANNQSFQEVMGHLLLHAYMFGWYNSVDLFGVILFPLAMGPDSQ